MAERAIGVLRERLAKGPARPVRERLVLALGTLGEALFALGEYDDARNAFEESASLAEDRALRSKRLLRIADCWERTGDGARAEEARRRARE